ncbi:hypothetical protein HYPSUDRAFT_56109 [Hypholoma sublateritium FD-334 SS-4]|uniref:F-box domain-containing protein n=1 Tax=Hypholoma sublateritium (strain FD-334 SS-4) TaxID=945553 RepID=A0A0D2L135_HYPSF|nr:hypothetical protein HYPSUDRAFT_56109 [Hypholoma sublateritium FD-334 SS-4]
MTTIKSLPVELLEEIFQCAYGKFINPSNHSKKPLRRNDKLPSPGRHSFPYNVASASSQWLDILKSSPRYWNRIIIDLAADPAPFLDVFSISQRSQNSDKCLDVIIFSSLKNRPHERDTFTATGVEYRRARTVFENLAPYIPRCRSIMFDLVYESSLPSAAVILSTQTGALRALCLTCEIDNIDFGLPRITPATNGPLGHSLQSLQTLSLTGFGFMELHHSGGGLSRLLSAGARLHLSIHHFHFVNSGPDISRSFVVFAAALQELDTCALELSLANLCMIDAAPPLRRTALAFQHLHKLTFDAVTADFITAFLGPHVIFPGGSVTAIAFSRCVIPRLRDDLNLNWSTGPLTLQLVDIPLSASVAGNTSLYNALEVLNADDILLAGCAGTTDALLRWFGGEAGAAPYSPALAWLEVRDCLGFTSAGIRALVEDRRARNASGERVDDECVASLASVCVSGQSPGVDAADLAYFAADDVVQWKMVED